MIGTIDIRVNAAKPNFPLSPFYAFINSPSQIRVVNVPRSIGDWEITAVYITANYPDNTSQSVACTLTGGCWHGTLPASTATGSSTNGFTITANGVKEDGETAVTGYVLGKGDVSILDTDGTITIGDTTYYLHFLDSVPTTPHKGDVCLISGSWKIYTGSAWVGFGGGGGDVCHSDFTSVDALGDRFTLNEVKGKVNEVLMILKGITLSILAAVAPVAALTCRAFALACAASLAARSSFAAIETQTAQLGSLYNDSLVVTNVTGAATDPGVVSNIVESYGYATEAWVTNKGYATEAWVTNKSYATTSQLSDAATAATNYTDTASAATLASATNYTDAAVASATPGDYANVSNRAYAAPVEYTWSSPDEWRVSIAHVSIDSNAVANIADIIGDCIISNEVTYRIMRRNAQAYALLTDETSYNLPNVTNWAVETGATITTNGYITTTADGIYRVTARTTDKTKYGYAVIQGETVTATTNASHSADVEGSYTKSVNDKALTKLNASSKVGDYTSGDKTYSVYSAQKVHITRTGAGNVSEFAVSPHILGTAAHYGSWIRWLGTQTFTDAAGNSATVTKTQWVNLKDWALENGWTEKEIYDADATDVAFVLCDSSAAVPDGCIPYFMSLETATAKFGTGYGLQAWHCSQYHEWAMPCTLMTWRAANASWNMFTITGQNSWDKRYVRTDILTKLNSMALYLNCCISGDSGRPIFFIDEQDRPIVVFANQVPYAGSSWVRAFHIIKAFVEAHGDTLKEAN